MVEGQAQSAGSDRIHRVQTLLLVCVGAVLLAGASAAEPCAAWPGEPRPLPRVDDRDEMLARWARLRVQELASAAQQLEADAPMRAHRLWRRVLCLEPASDAALAGIARTPPVAIHQPVLVTRPTDGQPADAWAGLSRPLRVAVPRPAPREPAPAPAGPDPDALIAALEQQVRGARFEEALAGFEAAQRAATAPAQRARVEVLGATAALALGRSDEADAHLGRALAADPELTLDPMTTPPKVRRALDRVRAERAR